jgi:hypothetical protein
VPAAAVTGFVLVTAVICHSARRYALVAQQVRERLG